MVILLGYRKGVRSTWCFYGGLFWSLGRRIRGRGIRDLENGSFGMRVSGQG